MTGVITSDGKRMGLKRKDRYSRGNNICCLACSPVEMRWTLKGETDEVLGYKLAFCIDRLGACVREVEDDQAYSTNETVQPPDDERGPHVGVESKVRKKSG